MIHTIPRRQFFQTGVAVALARLWSSSTIEAHPEVPSHRARLLYGCCAYSYRKYLAAGQMTMEDFILKGVELGVHAVDITTYWLKSTEPSYLVSLRRFAFKQGIPFSGVAISTNMCQPDSGKRVEELKKVKDWVDVTDLLGASHLRVFGG
jgi:sugar phosphate isomerase/epimerase